jgi:hypothetical protein
MQPPHSQDPAMRKEVRATLKANPAASYQTVLDNWHYRQHGLTDQSENSRLATIYEQELGTAATPQRAKRRRSWWRFW